MPETTDKDREGARRRETMDFARKIFKTFTGELQAHPIDITFERDPRIRAKAKAEALREAAERADAELKCEGFGKGKGSTRNLVHFAILADEPRTECVWTFEASTNSWDSACGEKWVFTADGPRENGVRYCHGCGKPVRIADEPNKGE